MTRTDLTKKIIQCVSLFTALLVSGCTSTDNAGHYSDYYSHYYDGVKTIAPTKATSRSYKIRGVNYTPQPHYEYVSEGYASYYGGRDVFHGRRTSTGEIFNKNGLTAAHRTLPLPCIVKVTNLENGRSVRVKVNDRGPFAQPESRIIDLSERTAKILGFHHKGIAKVRIETVVDDSVRVARGARVYNRSGGGYFTPAQFNQPMHKNAYTTSPLKVAYRDRSNRLLMNAKPRTLPEYKIRRTSDHIQASSHSRSSQSHHVMTLIRAKPRPQPLPKSKSRRMNIR